MKKINPKIFSFSCLLFLSFFLNLSAQEKFTLKGEINGQDIDGKTEARVIVCDNFSSINLLDHVSYGDVQTISYKAETNALDNHVFYPSLAGDGNHLITIINGQQTVDLTFEIPEISAGFFLGICRNKKSLELYTEEVYPKNDGKGKWSFLEENEKGDSEYDKYINQTTGIIDVSQIPFGFYTLKYEYGSCYDTRGIEITGADVFAGGDITVCQGFRGLSLNTYNNGTETPTINQEPIPSESNFKIEWIPKDKIIAENLNGDFISLLNIPAGTYDIDLVVTIIGETTNCEERDTRTIIVESIPEQPSVQGDSRCGPGEVTLKVLEPKEGFIYKWYREEIGESIEFTGTEYKVSLKSSTTFLVIASSKAGCESESAEVSGIIYYPPPTPEIELSDESICVGESITFYTGFFEGPAAPAEDGYIYNWYWDFEKQNPIKEATGPEYTHIFTNSDQNVIYVEIVDPETKCVSGLGGTKFVVNSIPNKPDVDDVSICEPGEVILTVNNPQDDHLYYWYENYDKEGENDPIGEPGTSITVGVEVDSKYYVLGISRAECESDVEEVQVSIIDKPEEPKTQGDGRCGPGEVILKVLEPKEGLTYKWYYEDDNEIGEYTGFSGVEYKAIIKGYTNFFVKAVANEDCESEPTKVSAVLYLTPPTPEIGLSNESICVGESITFNAAFFEGPAAPADEFYTYNWYWDAEKENQIKEATGPEYTHVFTSSDQNVIYVEVVDSETKCVSGLGEADFSVYPKPSKPKVSQDKFEICEKGTVKFTASGLEGGTYNWYWDEKKENVAAEGKSEFSFEFTISSNKKLYVEVIDPETNCVSDLTEVSVFFSENPEPPNIEDFSICGPGTVLLKPLVSEEENEPVFRFYPGEDSKYVFEGSEYEPEIKETTSYWITRIIGETCESEPKKITITILEEVPTPIVDGFVNCGLLGSYKLEVKNPVEGLSYLWYANEKDTKDASIGQGPSFLVENLNDTKVFWVEASNNNDCVGERISVEVTILEKPDTPEIADGISCGPGKVTLSIKNPDDNLIYKWFKSLEDETPVSTGSSYSTEEITTNTKFYVIAYSYFGEREIECLSESTEVEVQILESGEIGIGEDLQLCYDAPIYDLFQDLNIEGGSFSGSGVENGNQFNPKTAGFGKHEISFKYESNDGCSFTGTRIIEVIYPLNASEDLLTKTELVICSNEEFIDLMELEKKPGGEWSGDGVENGKFYPDKIGEGSGSVEYYIKENGCEYSAKVTIRVIDVNLESPDLSINKPLFCEGDMVKISVTNLDESLRYVWFNENSDSVGTGSSYEFIASATTTITCESKNSLDCGSDQSSIIVNVFSFPEEIVVSSNSISQHEFVQFSLDSTANTSYLWDFKTAETSTQRSPGYYFHEGGEFNVVVHMENTFLGCKDSLTTLIKVDFDQDDFVTGLEDEISTNKIDGYSITSYPQPFNNFIKLFFRSEKPIDAEVAIFSTDGKLMENKKLKLLKGEQDVDWETEKYPSGLYLIKINLPDSQKVIKALKQ